MDREVFRRRPALSAPGETTGAISTSSAALTPEALSLIQHALPYAALEYARQVNIPLSTDESGLQLALAVVVQSVADYLQTETVNLTSPAQAGSVIDDALVRRSRLLGQAQETVRDLERLSIGSFRRTRAFTLAIPPGDIALAKDEVRRFSLVPDPVAIKHLLSIKGAREASLSPSSASILEVQLGSFPLESKKFRPNFFEQGSTVRGVAAAVEHKLNTGGALDWLYVDINQVDKLARGITARGSPRPQSQRKEIGRNIVDFLILSTQRHELPRLESGVPPAPPSSPPAGYESPLPLLTRALSEQATDLFAAVLAQQEDTANRWLRLPASQDRAKPEYLEKLLEIWEGWPLLRNPLAYWIFNPQRITEARRDGKPHLWADPQVIELQGQRIAVPSPNTLTIALSVLERGDAPNPLLEKLKLARSEIIGFNRVQATYPERIQKLTGQLLEMDIPADVLDRVDTKTPPISFREVKGKLDQGNPVSPAELLALIKTVEERQKAATARLRLGGTAASLKRRIDQGERALRSDTRMRSIGGSFSPEILLKNPDIAKLVLDEWLYQMDLRLKRIRARKGRQLEDLRKPNWGGSPLWNRKSVAWTVETPEAVVAEVDRVGKWIDEIEGSPSNALPKDFQPHALAYLDARWEQRTQLPVEKQHREAERILTGRMLLKRSPHDPGERFKDWVLSELKQRQRTLLTLQETKTESDDLTARVESAKEASRLPRLPKEVAQQLVEFTASHAAAKQPSQWVTLRLLPEEVRTHPDLYADHLAQARRLVDLDKRTKSLTFTLPRLEQLPDTLAAQRKRPIAQEGKLPEPGWDDEPKSALIRKFLDLLESIGKNDDNPFVPLSAAEGINLGPFMQVVGFRARVAEAVLNLPKLRAEYLSTREALERAKVKRREEERFGQAQRIAAQIRHLTDEFQSSTAQLVARMKHLGLAVDPEVLKDSSPKK